MLETAVFADGTKAGGVAMVGGGGGAGGGGGGYSAVEDKAWASIRGDMFREYPYCRFARFHVKGFEKQYLKKGAKAYEGRWRVDYKASLLNGGRKAARRMIEEREARKKKDEEKKKRRLGRKKKKKNPRGAKAGDERAVVVAAAAPALTNRTISYIHIGKAGGSSMSCYIRAAFPYMKDMHCRMSSFPSDDPSGPPESAISRQTDCYAHYDTDKQCYFINKSFLFNVRHPIHRIASWYLYEHVWNSPFTYNIRRTTDGARCGNLMLSTCYRSFDELATVGLRGPRPSRKRRLRVGNDLTEGECSHWAWAAVQGEVPANFHNVFNYDWYASDILSRDDAKSESESEGTEIFAVRMEHLDEDWRNLDVFVGGTGDALPNVDVPVNSASDKALPVADKSVSGGGIANLCRALCGEIQIYKALLARASNLVEDDRRASLEELRETCPEEVDLRPRTCEE
uniref:Uncharacterized protein n=1 Tax=Odontella aurita TaxID=265563 RepID=A0A7S4JZD7_9STRA